MQAENETRRKGEEWARAFLATLMYQTLREDYRMWSEPWLGRELQSFHGLYKDEVVYLCQTLIFFGRTYDNRVPFFIILLLKNPTSLHNTTI